ncbi:MAG: cyclic nucleotide-binding domain-containing protein [Gaiellaceae bacterium]
MAEVPDKVLAYLDGQPTLTLASVGAGGVPRATTLTYVNDRLNVFVWMRPETTTARQIQENPVVSFAVDRYADDWRETQGIQAAAEARVVLNPGELTHVIELFERKYPALAGMLDRGVSIFRLTPTELQFIDNSNASASWPDGGVPYARDTVFSVFRDLPKEAIENVAGELKTVQVEEGDVVVRQGAPADKFFIIVDGEVDVLHEQQGETRRVATLGKGQFFGEMAVLRDTPRTATVQATRPTTLFAMDRDAFRGLVAQSMGTTRDFDQVIERRLDEIRGSHGAA